MIQLTQPDFDRLTAILESLADWRTEQARIDLLDGIFAGSSRKRDVVRIRLDGTARQAAVRAIQHLAQFGQDAPGRETLLAFAAGLLPCLGVGADADFLRQLQERHAPAALPRAPVDVAPAPDSVTVYETLTRRFSLDEMRDLCFRLRIEHDEIGGATSLAFARELVRYLERRGRLAELVDLIRKLRGPIL